ncbi:hypothetical protein [Streptomyces prasinopilosus]|uniref:Uncharacterized protein n=1 Tax=Streptomyces prasinopilosus TaxID=67344 RepID=A0A1G6NQE3_9ACTN|nr:hypothetical protein [Streptomyces prasinopilosus]SDC69395.1 hypothetical protein SAMN05216505_103189 [Streptomyces prasinopilosus]
MEQRIGSSSQPQPLEGAGFDPAFIPGLTAPVSGTSDREADVKDAKGSKGEEEPRDAVPEPEAATSPEKPGTSGAAEASADPGAAGSSEGEPAPDGPVFEASDRRAGIVVDHSGVRLRLDDQACEFRWDEIGAVETETARFGKRYTVTVHTTEGRWYPIEIEAPSRGRFAAWDTELDAVLDAYFDDGTSGAETSGSSGAEAPGTDSPDADPSDPDAVTGKTGSDAGADPSDDDADKPGPDAGPAV